MDGFFQNSRDEPPPTADASASTSTPGSPTPSASTPGSPTPTEPTSTKPTTGEQVASDNSFSEAIQVVTALALKTFQQEIKIKQLYYHNIEHVEGVSRRAQLIFDTAVPFYPQKYSADVDWNRQRQLLHLSAIAHDMLQIFRPQLSAHTPRQRRGGESEKATVKKLLSFLREINTTESKASNTEACNVEALEASIFTYFKPDDIQILEEAIEATICQYDENEGSIYQPWLYAEYRDGQPISLVARCLALADIGTLGIDGIKAYNREGRLLLLEENLDIIPFLRDETNFDNAFRENVRQRLLKRARFEISFAKGRLKRLDPELAGLPMGAIAQLKQKVFKHLTTETIQTLEATTPTAEETPLSELLNYFQLKPYVFQLKPYVHQQDLQARPEG